MTSLDEHRPRPGRPRRPAPPPPGRTPTGRTPSRTPPRREPPAAHPDGPPRRPGPPEDVPTSPVGQVGSGPRPRPPARGPRPPDDGGALRRPLPPDDVATSRMPLSGDGGGPRRPPHDPREAWAGRGARQRPRERPAPDRPAPDRPAERPVPDRPVPERPALEAVAQSSPPRRPARPGPSTDDDVRRDAAGRTRVRREATLGRALLTTLAATVVPGAGHVLLRRRRTGIAIVAAFVLAVGTLVVLLLRADRSQLLATLLSSRLLAVVIVAILFAALAWMGVVVQTWRLARPVGLRPGQRAIGIGVVTALCLAVATPLGFGAQLANSQRQLLDRLFPAAGGGTPVTEAIGKARLNVLLVGSDAGPDRRGTRTDTMMVASVDTRAGRTVLFALPRNIQRAPFPNGSPMGRRFPNGFHDAADPLSGDYLLNAVYAYAHANPDVAPPGPTADPGLNLLNSSVETMLGLPLDYYVEVNMAGFASIIDALGGLTVDVGPEPLPVGGITPTGRHVRPDRYIPAGVQHLNGVDTLAVARSRTNTDDYTRMGRQRCLLQYVLQQKSPTDLLTHFQDVAGAAGDSVSTNIPQQVLPALVKVADNPGATALDSVSFDPNLADPTEPDGRFDTSRPDVTFMRQVVRETIAGPRATATPAPITTPPPTTAARAAGRTGKPRPGAEDTPTTRPEPTTGPVSLAQAC